jgi:uracil-DNA glycosylase
MTDDLSDIISGLKSYIDLEKAFGFEECVFSVSTPKTAMGSQASTLDALRKEVVSCKACDLHKTRQNVVFGAGSPKAKLMFIGEAPGQDEDLQGLPFVGKAGQLLTKIIEAMDLKREDVYIANILKSRPPDNRDPLPDEIAACEPYLHAQIKLIKPKLICSLGRIAAQTLLRTKMTLGEMRGRWFDYQGTKFTVIYHPAAILRSMSYLEPALDDLRRLLAELEKMR